MSAEFKFYPIDFCDFYAGLCKTDNFFHNLLKERFPVYICEKPKFLIYSHQGDEHKLHRGIRIFFTEESFLPDFRECDYAFTCFNLDTPRHLRLPFYVLYGPPEPLVKGPDFDAGKILAAKTRFCSFVTSNPNLRKTRQRVEFFQKLSRYKKVDSAGRVLNNLGENIPGFSKEKVEFMRQYKFNLCFENKSLPGYTTEKIYEAMRAHCLPIYWGSPEIATEFNPRSFLNYFDFPSEEALIEKIIELDKDDNQYLEYLRQPYFHGNRPSEFFSHERLLNQFEKIFTSPIEPVAQRRRLFSFGRWMLVRSHKGVME